MFVLARDRSWDEGLKLIPNNGIYSGYCFSYAVSLSSDRSLIEAGKSDETGDYSGEAYIFHRMNEFMSGGSQYCLR